MNYEDFKTRIFAEHPEVKEEYERITSPEEIDKLCEEINKTNPHLNATPEELSKAFGK